MEKTKAVATMNDIQKLITSFTYSPASQYNFHIIKLSKSDGFVCEQYEIHGDYCTFFNVKEPINIGESYSKVKLLPYYSCYRDWRYGRYVSPMRDFRRGMDLPDNIIKPSIYYSYKFTECKTVKIDNQLSISSYTVPPTGDNIKWWDMSVEMATKIVTDEIIKYNEQIKELYNTMSSLEFAEQYYQDYFVNYWQKYCSPRIWANLLHKVCPPSKLPDREIDKVIACMQQSPKEIDTTNIINVFNSHRSNKKGI